jgi:hypothetical protein
MFEHRLIYMSPNSRRANRNRDQLREEQPQIEKTETIEESIQERSKESADTAESLEEVSFASLAIKRLGELADDQGKFNELLDKMLAEEDLPDVGEIRVTNAELKTYNASDINNLLNLCKENDDAFNKVRAQISKTGPLNAGHLNLASMQLLLEKTPKDERQELINVIIMSPTRIAQLVEANTETEFIKLIPKETILAHLENNYANRFSAKVLIKLIEDYKIIKAEDLKGVIEKLTFEAQVALIGYRSVRNKAIQAISDRAWDSGKDVSDFIQASEKYFTDNINNFYKRVCNKIVENPDILNAFTPSILRKVVNFAKENLEEVYKTFSETLGDKINPAPQEAVREQEKRLTSVPQKINHLWTILQDTAGKSPMPRKITAGSQNDPRHNYFAFQIDEHKNNQLIVQFEGDKFRICLSKNWDQSSLRTWDKSIAESLLIQNLNKLPNNQILTGEKLVRAKEQLELAKVILEKPFPELTADEFQTIKNVGERIRDTYVNARNVNDIRRAFSAADLELEDKVRNEILRELTIKFNVGEEPLEWSRKNTFTEERLKKLTQQILEARKDNELFQAHSRRSLYEHENREIRLDQMTIYQKNELFDQEYEQFTTKAIHLHDSFAYQRQNKIEDNWIFTKNHHLIDEVFTSPPFNCQDSAVVARIAADVIAQNTNDAIMFKDFFSMMDYGDKSSFFFLKYKDELGPIVDEIPINLLKNHEAFLDKYQELSKKMRNREANDQESKLFANMQSLLFACFDILRIIPHLQYIEGKEISLEDLITEYDSESQEIIRKTDGLFGEAADLNWWDKITGGVASIWGQGHIDNEITMIDMDGETRVMTRDQFTMYFDLSADSALLKLINEEGLYTMKPTENGFQKIIDAEKFQEKITYLIKLGHKNWLLKQFLADKDNIQYGDIIEDGRPLEDQPGFKRAFRLYSALERNQCPGIDTIENMTKDNLKGSLRTLAENEEAMNRFKYGFMLDQTKQYQMQQLALQKNAQAGREGLDQGKNETLAHLTEEMIRVGGLSPEKANEVINSLNFIPYIKITPEGINGGAGFGMDVGDGVRFTLGAGYGQGGLDTFGELSFQVYKDDKVIVTSGLGVSLKGVGARVSVQGQISEYVSMGATIFAGLSFDANSLGAGIGISLDLSRLQDRTFKEREERYKEDTGIGELWDQLSFTNHEKLSPSEKMKIIQSVDELDGVFTEIKKQIPEFWGDPELSTADGYAIFFKILTIYKEELQTQKLDEFTFQDIIQRIAIALPLIIAGAVTMNPVLLGVGVAAGISVKVNQREIFIPRRSERLRILQNAANESLKTNVENWFDGLENDSSREQVERTNHVYHSPAHPGHEGMVINSNTSEILEGFGNVDTYNEYLSPAHVRLKKANLEGQTAFELIVGNSADRIVDLYIDPTLKSLGLIVGKDGKLYLAGDVSNLIITRKTVEYPRPFAPNTSNLVDVIYIRQKGSIQAGIDENWIQEHSRQMVQKMPGQPSWSTEMIKANAQVSIMDQPTDETSDAEKAVFKSWMKSLKDVTPNVAQAGERAELRQTMDIAFNDEDFRVSLDATEEDTIEEARKWKESLINGPVKGILDTLNKEASDEFKHPKALSNFNEIRKTLMILKTDLMEEDFMKNLNAVKEQLNIQMGEDQPTYYDAIVTARENLLTEISGLNPDLLRRIPADSRDAQFKQIKNEIQTKLNELKSLLNQIPGVVRSSFEKDINEKVNENILRNGRELDITRRLNKNPDFVAKRMELDQNPEANEEEYKTLIKNFLDAEKLQIPIPSDTNDLVDKLVKIFMEDAKLERAQNAQESVELKDEHIKLLDTIFYKNPEGPKNHRLANEAFKTAFGNAIDNPQELLKIIEKAWTNSSLRESTPLPAENDPKRAVLLNYAQNYLTIQYFTSLYPRAQDGDERAKLHNFTVEDITGNNSFLVAHPVNVQRDGYTNTIFITSKFDIIIRDEKNNTFIPIHADKITWNSFSKMYNDPKYREYRKELIAARRLIQKYKPSVINANKDIRATMERVRNSSIIAFRKEFTEAIKRINNSNVGENIDETRAEELAIILTKTIYENVYALLRDTNPPLDLRSADIEAIPQFSMMLSVSRTQSPRRSALTRMFSVVNGTNADQLPYLHGFLRDSVVKLTGQDDKDLRRILLELGSPYQLNKVSEEGQLDAYNKATTAEENAEAAVLTARLDAANKELIAVEKERIAEEARSQQNIRSSINSAIELKLTEIEENNRGKLSETKNEIRSKIANNEDYPHSEEAQTEIMNSVTEIIEIANTSINEIKNLIEEKSIEAVMGAIQAAASGSTEVNIPNLMEEIRSLANQEKTNTIERIKNISIPTLLPAEDEAQLRTQLEETIKSILEKTIKEAINTAKKEAISISTKTIEATKDAREAQIKAVEAKQNLAQTILTEKQAEGETRTTTEALQETYKQALRSPLAIKLLSSTALLFLVKEDEKIYRELIQARDNIEEIPDETFDSIKEFTDLLKKIRNAQNAGEKFERIFKRDGGDIKVTIELQPTIKIGMYAKCGNPSVSVQETGTMTASRRRETHGNWVRITDEPLFGQTVQNDVLSAAAAIFGSPEKEQEGEDGKRGGPSGDDIQLTSEVKDDTQGPTGEAAANDSQNRPVGAQE